MAEYPTYEIKVVYDCQFCKSNHISTARAKGSELANELAIGGTLRRKCKELATSDVVKSFFYQHPKAKSGSFDVNRLIGHEITVHDEITTDKDKIGIPLVQEEIERIRKEMGLLRTKKEKDVTEKSFDELLEDTKVMKEKWGFDEISGMFGKQLKKLKEEEKTLSAQLLLIKTEREKFEKLFGAMMEIKSESGKTKKS